jgi:hypothetical protein
MSTKTADEVEEGAAVWRLRKFSKAGDDETKEQLTRTGRERTLMAEAAALGARGVFEPLKAGEGTSSTSEVSTPTVSNLA